MGKRKHSKYGVRREFLIVLGIVLFVFGATVLVVSQSALGDYENQNNDDEKGNSENHSNKTLNETQTTIQNVIPTVVNSVMPTYEPVIQPTATPFNNPTEPPVEMRKIAPTYSDPTYSVPSLQSNQNAREYLPVINQPEIKTVSVSGRSVVNQQEGAKPVTKSSGGFIDSIKRGFESIGVGRISTPTTTPKPTPTVKPTEKYKEQILPDQMKLKYQFSGGQVSLTAEDKTGKSINVDETKLRDLESSMLSRLEKKGLSLNLTPDNQLAVIDGKVTALTDLPILIDVDTNSLVVSTRDGLVPMNFTPDKALKNVIALKMIANVNSKVVPKIEYSDGEVIYKFEATKVYKVFGKIPVTVPVSISVSAGTGDVVSRNQPFITRVVSLLSL